MACLDTRVRRRWPNGIVRYRIDPALEADVQARCELAVQRIEAQTMLVFQRLAEDDNSAPNIRIRNRIIEDDFSHTDIGADPNGTRTIWLQEDASRGAVEHELCHTIGLRHEHRRPDRAGFVEFNGNNFEGPFIATEALVALTGVGFGPYDYESNMHYGPFAFGRRVPFEWPQRYNAASVYQYSGAGGAMAMLLYNTETGQIRRSRMRGGRPILDDTIFNFDRQLGPFAHFRIDDTTYEVLIEPDFRELRIFPIQENGRRAAVARTIDGIGSGPFSNIVTFEIAGQTMIAFNNIGRDELSIIPFQPVVAGGPVRVLAPGILAQQVADHPITRLLFTERNGTPFLVCLDEDSREVSVFSLSVDFNFAPLPLGGGRPQLALTLAGNAMWPDQWIDFQTLFHPDDGVDYVIGYDPGPGGRIGAFPINADWSLGDPEDHGAAARQHDALICYRDGASYAMTLRVRNNVSEGRLFRLLGPAFDDIEVEDNRLQTIVRVDGDPNDFENSISMGNTSVQTLWDNHGLNQLCETPQMVQQMLPDFDHGVRAGVDRMQTGFDRVAAMTTGSGRLVAARSDDAVVVYGSRGSDDITIRQLDVDAPAFNGRVPFNRLAGTETRQASLGRPIFDFATASRLRGDNRLERFVRWPYHLVATTAADEIVHARWSSNPLTGEPETAVMDGVTMPQGTFVDMIRFQNRIVVGFSSPGGQITVGNLDPDGLGSIVVTASVPTDSGGGDLFFFERLGSLIFVQFSAAENWADLWSVSDDGSLVTMTRQGLGDGRAATHGWYDEDGDRLFLYERGDGGVMAFDIGNQGQIALPRGEQIAIRDDVTDIAHLRVNGVSYACFVGPWR